MSKIVVVEIEVEDDDKGIVGKIASHLSPYNVLSIGIKKNTSAHRATWSPDA